MLSFEIIAVIVIFIITVLLGVLVYASQIYYALAINKINNYFYDSASALASQNPTYKNVKDAFMAEFTKRFNDNINKTSTCLLPKFRESIKKTDNEIANMSDTELDTALAQYLDCCDSSFGINCENGKQQCTDGQVKCLDKQMYFILFVLTTNCNIGYNALFDYAQTIVGEGSDLKTVLMKFYSDKCGPPDCDTCAQQFKDNGGCLSNGQLDATKIPLGCESCAGQAILKCSQP
jgi:hypothetical protein